MPYSQDFAGSARRHLKAAQSLYETESASAKPGNQAVAGYLFGVAGELAVKQLMRASGMRPLPNDQRREDPFFSHFPELKTRLLETGRGWHAGRLRRVAEDSTLFQHWDTDMRYAPTREIDQQRVTAWKASAEKLLMEMDDYGA